MSIVNVLMQKDRALVAVDTKAETLGPQGTTYHAAQKARLYGDVLVAYRGGLGMPTALSVLLLDGGRLWRMDDLLPRLPGLLNGAQAAAGEAMRVQGVTEANLPAAARGSEVTFVGWSDRERRMKGVVAERQPGGTDWAIDEIHTTMFAPHFEGWERANLQTPAGLKAAAAKQIEAFRRVDPSAAIGGELVLYDMRRDGLTVRKLGAI